MARAKPSPLFNTSLRSLLIISPRFPPLNAPDHQRVRMSLPYLRDFGWQPTVIALEPELLPEYEHGKNADANLLDSVPVEVEVVRVGAVDLKQLTRLSSRLGSAKLDLRCLPTINRAMRELSKKRKFDVAYFSTTMFTTMSLGAQWRKSYGLPFVVDLQDPWLTDYYTRPGAPSPPGGRLKHRLAQSVARVLEPFTLRRASHIITVSPAYQTDLMRRYKWLTASDFTVLPFGAPELDFDVAQCKQVAQTVFDSQDGKKHWVYVGRAGGDMHFALRALFSAIKELRAAEPALWNQVKLHFIGTNYATGKQSEPVVQPIADELGVGDLVEEHTARVPYYQAIKVLIDADAVLLIGSDDAGYTASKLYPCILAQRPLLAIFHEASSVVEIIRRCRAGDVATFNANLNGIALKEKLTAKLAYLIGLPPDSRPDVLWREFEPYTAREMTRAQCRIFDKVAVAGSNTSPANVK